MGTAHRDFPPAMNLERGSHLARWHFPPRVRAARRLL
nr:MAG TPA: hypothetical protein [Caudoviricetes sp.]